MSCGGRAFLERAWFRALPGQRIEAGEVRAWVVGALTYALDAERLVDAEIMAGEVIGNALRHTLSGTEGGRVEVAVEWRAERVVVAGCGWWTTWPATGARSWDRSRNGGCGCGSR